MFALHKRTLSAFHRRLHDWYAQEGRHALPWRQTPDPYAIWLSEVMLQQTQVSTVLTRFYLPFLEKFPTVQALAQADRQDVMKAWEGLGYYRRAGYLHEAAQEVVAAGGWKKFNTVEALEKLPGIGRNTANAVACFGFGRAVPVMEANLKRLLARIFALETPSEAELWDAANALMDSKHSFNYNQAMMDVGSMVCTPRKPTCMLCPAADICIGKAEPERYPQKKTKKATPTREKQLIAARIMWNGKPHYYMEPREGALLGGLWGFPQVEPDAKKLELNRAEHSLSKCLPLGDLVHIYSHFRLEGAAKLLPLKPPLYGNQWFTIEQIHELPLSGIDKKMLALLEKL